MAASGPHWYAPTDQWPRHPKPWFRDALGQARAAGWWYRKSADSSHIHGTAFCQRPEDLAEPCKFPVFATGNAGEDAARDLVRMVGRCPHNQTSGRPLAQASLRLQRVELLCKGAEALLDRYDHNQKLAHLLDRAEQLLDEAGDGAGLVDDLLQAVDDVELEAEAARTEAERVLTLADTDLRDPAEVLNIAEDDNNKVREVLVTAVPSVDVRNLKKRVRDARAKIWALRSRLPES